MITAAGSERPFQKHTAADLLYFTEQLESLVISALVLSRKPNRNRRAVMPAGTAIDITQTALYAGGLGKNKPWHCFPRSLSEAEFRNPYGALKKTAAHAGKKEWKGILHNLLHYALSAQSAAESGDSIELVWVYTMLQKVLDGCYLVYVRG